jgi:photosystem II stability/assembly factor-like uncharacterized protein
MKPIYRLIILILAFTSLTINAQEVWKLEDSFISEDLNDIHFYDTNTGWIVGNNGAMLYKSGEKWLLYPKITNEDLYSVFLTGRESGWAVGSKGTILKLEGRKWYNITSPTRATLYDISFLDSSHGTAVGANGTILSYINGLWSRTMNNTKGILHAVSYGKDFNLISGGMECGSVPIYEYQNNEPESFNSFDPGYYFIKDIAVQADGQAWAVGTAGILLHFNGIEWIKSNMHTTVPTLNSTSFYDSTDGIAVGFGGTLLRYHESGWEIEDSPSSITLNGSAISERAYYAVGNKGMIISKSRKSYVDESLAVSSKNIIQVDSYPNPASDYIDILLPEADALIASDLSILNADGKVLVKMNIEPGNAGSTMRINLSAIGNGMYLIHLRSRNNESAFGKFLVAKKR